MRLPLKLRDNRHFACNDNLFGRPQAGCSGINLVFGIDSGFQRARHNRAFAFCWRKRSENQHGFCAKRIVTNPLILGVFIGFICLAIRFLIPAAPNGNKLFTIRQNLPLIYKTIAMLAQSASPIALLALGGNFTFSAVARLKYKIIAGVLARTIICPIVCLSAAYALGFRTLEFPALIALYGTPLAVSTVPMSAEMGSDGELAGQLVVWTTLVSAFTLFSIIFTCAQLGLLSV